MVEVEIESRKERGGYEERSYRERVAERVSLESPPPPVTSS